MVSLVRTVIDNFSVDDEIFSNEEIATAWKCPHLALRKFPHGANQPDVIPLHPERVQIEFHSRVAADVSRLLSEILQKKPDWSKKGEEKKVKEEEVEAWSYWHALSRRVLENGSSIHPSDNTSRRNELPNHNYYYSLSVCLSLSLFVSFFRYRLDYRTLRLKKETKAKKEKRNDTPETHARRSRCRVFRLRREYCQMSEF